jgi:hypothetical protein
VCQQHEACNLTTLCDRPERLQLRGVAVREFRLWRGIRARGSYSGSEGRELELLTSPVRASDSASVARTSAPIERLLFVGTQWPVAFACPTMPAARHGTVPYAHCNHDAPRRMAVDATVRNGRPNHHFASGPWQRLRAYACAHN